jgi:hypothetical protein
MNTKFTIPFFLLAPLLVASPEAAERSTFATALAEAAHVQPNFLQAEVVKNELGTYVPKEAIPAKVLDRALMWFKRVVRPEWLPNNISDITFGRKDALVWELRDDRGKVDSFIKADYVIARYALNDVDFTLLESGEEVIFRADFAKPAALEAGEHFLKSFVNKFLAVPADKSASDASVRKIGSASRLFNVTPVNPFDAKGNPGNVYWYQYIDAISDGQSLIIVMPELSPGEWSRKTTVARPDRF